MWVITGASRGIGLELVQQLVARGDVVVAAARNPETCSALKELESSSSGKLHLVKMDVEDPETIKVMGNCTTAALFPILQQLQCNALTRFILLELPSKLDRPL